MFSTNVSSCAPVYTRRLVFTRRVCEFPNPPSVKYETPKQKFLRDLAATPGIHGKYMMNSLTCLLNIYLCKSHFYLCKFHQKHPKVINKTRSFLCFWEGTSPSDTLVPTGAEVLSVLDLGAPSFKKSWIRPWFLRWLHHMYSHRWLWSFLDWCACLTECLFARTTKILNAAYWY